MISSASTLLLATMVFNAASVLGAPIRLSERQPSVIPRAVSEPAAAVYLREDAFPEFMKARDTAEIPSPAVQKREVTQPSRRYPRRIYHDRHENPSAAPRAAPANVERDEVVEVGRRFPRKIYEDFYQKREPATTIKEFSLKTVKTTTFDSPADAVAYLGAGGKPKSETSTSVSSSATTIGAIPTPPAGAPGTPGGVPSPVPTPVPGSPDPGVKGSPTSSAAPSATPTPASPVTPPAGSPGTPGTDQPPPKPADATPPTPGSGGPAPSCATPPVDGSPCPPSTPPTPGSPDPTTPTPGGSGDPSTTEPKSPGSRREVTSQPIARRMAVSGASLASAVRRQLNQS